MRAPVRRLLVAFAAGLASLFPWFGLVDKHVAMASAFMAAYYLLAQLLLSRGRPRAYGTDWATMLVLDAPALLLGLAFLGRSPVECIPLLYCTVAGTYAGAVAASLGARSRWPVLRGSAPLPRVLIVSAGAFVGGLAVTPFAAVLESVLARSIGCAPPGGRAQVTAACLWLFKASSIIGALGMAVGAYLAGRRRGRLALLLACALVIGVAAAAAWEQWGRALSNAGHGYMLALWLVAQLLAIALVERATAVHGPEVERMSPNSADAPEPATSPPGASVGADTLR